MSSPFFKLTRGLMPALAEEGLGDGDLHVLYQMLTFWAPQNDNEIYPSVETLCFLTGYSRRKVQRALRCIQKTGLLVAVSGGVQHEPVHWRVGPQLRLLLQEYL